MPNQLDLDKIKPFENVVSAKMEEGKKKKFIYSVVRTYVQMAIL